MGVEPVGGFAAHTTHHCVTGSLRNIYTFHGLQLSEEMLLGLGAGLGFIYWQQKGMLPFLGGRANFERPGEKGLEKWVGERTGVAVESHYTASRRTAERALFALLDAGEPVMIYLDMGFLPYMDLPEDYHFGGHSVVVAGYDAASGTALIADRDGLLHPMALELLAQARGSTFKPFPPGNAWYTFDFAQKRPPTSDALRDALRAVAIFMLEPPIANFGVKGIRTAAARMAKWPEALGEEATRQSCFTGFVSIDAMGGTGGGIFRLMYARFLLEAAELLGDARLAALSHEVQAIGESWQEVALLLRAASGFGPSPAPEPPPLQLLLAQAAAQLKGVADCEDRAWQQLRAIVG